MVSDQGSVPSLPTTTHAGGVVYRVVDGEVLYALVRSNDPVPVWVWPTGHLEPGETPAQAALREVREETGIAARVVAELPGRSFQRRGEWGRIAYFLLEHSGAVATQELRPVAWTRFGDACALLAHPESVELLTGVQPVLLDTLAKSGEPSAASNDWAAELLMKDYDALTQELERNEARGETRLSIYLTIVTAVIAGLVSLSAEKSQVEPTFVKAVGAFGMSALLALGLVLFLRMLKRDEKTDGFEQDLKQARDIVRSKLDPAGLLANWAPFKPKRTIPKDRIGQADGTKSRRIGGLADLVAVINSILVGGLVLLATGVEDASVWSGLGATFIAVVSFWLHVVYRRRRQ